MRKGIITKIFIPFFLFLFLHPVFASSSNDDQGKSNKSFLVSHKSSHVFKSEVEAQEGNFASSRMNLNLQKKYTFENGLPLDIALTLEHYFIHDTTSVGLPSSLQSKGISIGTKFPMPFTEGDRFFIGMEAAPCFQTAKEHGFDSDAFRLKSRLYGIYRKQEDQRLIVAAGIMMYSGYDDQTALPFVGFQYDMNDRWSLNFLSNEPFIAYRATHQTIWKIMFGSYGDEFEVVSGERKGDAVKVGEFHAGIGVGHHVTKDIYLELSGGMAFNRKYEYLDNGGKVVPEDGIFIAYSFRARF